MERNREIREYINGAEAYWDEPLHEYVKCVVIGDTAVGKTRLICSHVYGYEGMPLELINSKPHLPTVFAIDQYMSEPVVRNRARYIIDGVHVCLRIWDTFGDHDKNRKFAYQHAHVVVMCYSIGMPASLRNINAKWFLEIRKYCPRVPIILVGTQLDRRHTDSNRFRTIGHARLRSYLAGHHDITTTTHPLVPPEVGRQTAREIGAYGYYETSIVTKFGVDAVFENAIRAALVGRRKARPVLSSHLKRIEKPALQEPYLPPKPTAPTAHVPPSRYTEEQSSLYGNKELADVIFLVDGEPVYGHIVMLIASSPVFAALFINPAILHTFMFHEDISSPQLLINTGNLVLQDGYINGTASLMPRGFVSLDTVNDESLGNCSIAVKVCGIASKCFGKVLEFLYTGAIQEPGNIVELLTTASLLQITSLTDYANNLLTSTEYMNVEVERQMRIHTVADIYHQFFNKPLFSDVTFVVDGNEIPAHKAMLIPHCQMMAGMFRNGNFRESGTATVSSLIYSTSLALKDSQKFSRFLWEVGFGVLEPKTQNPKSEKQKEPKPETSFLNNDPET